MQKAYLTRFTDFKTLSLYTYRYQINTYSARGIHAEHGSLFLETTSESRRITYINVNINYLSFRLGKQIRRK
jgi:hypothetical protein